MITVKKKPITNAEAGKILESAKDEMTSLQRVVHDYATKFSKLDADESVKLLNQLIEEIGLDESTAVQLVNCVPTSLEEIRTILGRQRIISEEDLRKILGIIERHVKRNET